VQPQMGVVEGQVNLDDVEQVNLDDVGAPLRAFALPVETPLCHAMLPPQPDGRAVMPKNHFTPAAQRAGREAGAARANQVAAELAPVIAELRAAGITSKMGIAKALNMRGIPTPRGVGEWRPIQVARVLARLPG
jgi:hypothetical protein